MEELRGKTKAHRDGLAATLGPLQEQIKMFKSSFWERNQEAIEAFVKECVEHKLQGRVVAEASNGPSTPLAPRRFNRPHLQIKKAVQPYCEYLEVNEENNERLKTAMDIS